MSAAVINLVQARAEKVAEASRLAAKQSRETTVQFARLLNDSVDQHQIDPVHQATLLMAKAIDVLAAAGPVPSTLQDQHCRADNLLHSVFRARRDLLEKSVRIVTAETLNQPVWEQDGLSL